MAKSTNSKAVVISTPSQGTNKQGVAPTSAGSNKLLPQRKPTPKALSSTIVPIQLQRIRQNTLTWRDAIVEATYAYYPYRVKMQQMFADTKDNGHVSACVERRKDLTLLRKFEFVNSAGTLDATAMDVFTINVKNKTQVVGWFNEFLSHALDALFYGYSLIELGSVVDNRFPDISTVRRWNISPDRKQVTTFPYQPHGFKFEEEPFSYWHVWVDTPNELGESNCGNGLYYKIALYEIFMRNNIAYNADFIELYAQPYRLGKTTKTEEGERAELAAALQQMGSNGWAIIDPTDEISFLETALGGTGYQSYDNFEKRLEATISKVILGHADAVSSTPGKLGSDKGEESPAQSAMEDKQTKDGAFIENVVNDKLLPRLRALGFLIPDDVRMTFKNDTEVLQTADKLAVIATKMLAGGLQMSAEHYTQETGIPCAIPAVPTPAPFGGPADKTQAPKAKELPAPTKDKLKALYDQGHSIIKATKLD